MLSKFDRIIVAGDIHGDYKTFQQIHDSFHPQQDYLIFLGDYADRGREGIEVINGIKKLMINYPRQVIALKGNHEDYSKDGTPRFMPCDLINEVGKKRSSWNTYFMEDLTPFIDKLYIAALMSGSILFVHGGVSSKIQSITDLKNPSRSVEEDILWSDPFDGFGEYPNMRGAGVMFGQDISNKICHMLHAKIIVRSHQPRKAWQGPYTEHNGRVVTISSTTVYGGTPFILNLPIHNLNNVLTNLGDYTQDLRPK